MPVCGWWECEMGGSVAMENSVVIPPKIYAVSQQFPWEVKKEKIPSRDPSEFVYICVGSSTIPNKQERSSPSVQQQLNWLNKMSYTHPLEYLVREGNEVLGHTATVDKPCAVHTQGKTRSHSEWLCLFRKSKIGQLVDTELLPGACQRLKEEAVGTRCWLHTEFPHGGDSGCPA